VSGKLEFFLRDRREVGVLVALSPGHEQCVQQARQQRCMPFFGANVGGRDDEYPIEIVLVRPHGEHVDETQRDRACQLTPAEPGGEDHGLDEVDPLHFQPVDG